MDRPDIRELEYFAAVAEELNFARAAERLHLTQPPLSRQVKALEERLGVMLLRRDTKSMEVTAAGRLFLEEVQDILRRLDRAITVAQRAAAGEVERFDVGFAAATLDARITRLFRLFRERHPNCQIRLHEMSPPELLKAVRERKIAGAFIGSAPVSIPRELRTVPWLKEPVSIVLPQEHRLAKENGVHLRDLAKETWILVSREGAPGFYRKFHRWCQNEGFHPRIAAESQQIAAVLAMVSVGEGISMVPSSTFTRFQASSEVRFQRLLSPNVSFVYVFVCRENDESFILREFTALMKKFSST